MSLLDTLPRYGARHILLAAATMDLGRSLTNVVLAGCIPPGNRQHSAYNCCAENADSIVTNLGMVC